MHVRGAPMHELLDSSALFMNFWIGPIFENYFVIMIETLINNQTLKIVDDK